MKSIYQNLPKIFEDFSHRANVVPAIKLLSESTAPVLNPQVLTLRLLQPCVIHRAKAETATDAINLVEAIRRDIHYSLQRSSVDGIGPVTLMHRLEEIDNGPTLLTGKFGFFSSSLQVKDLQSYAAGISTAPLTLHNSPPTTSSSPPTTINFVLATYTSCASEPIQSIDL